MLPADTGVHVIRRLQSAVVLIRTAIAAALPAVFTVVMLWMAGSSVGEANGEPGSILLAQASTPQPDRLISLHTAPLVVNGEKLFELAGIESLPARIRARRVAERIERLARNPDFDPDTLQAVEQEDGYAIVAGDAEAPLLVVTTVDAGFQGVPVNHVAESFRERIAEVIQAYRNDRKPEVLLRNALHALLRTVILIGVLLGVFWGFRRIDDILERHFKRRIQRLEARSMRIVQAEQIWSAVRITVRVLRALVVLVVVYAFLNFVLSLFPWTRYVARLLWDLALEPLHTIASGIVGYLPSLIFLVLLFLAARYTLKAIRTFFEAVARERIQLKGFDADWALPTYRLVRVGVIILAVVLAYPYIPGSDSQAFKGISILLGVLLSLGSTSMIANIVAGYTMTYRRAFRVGDRVRIGDTVGDVTEIRMLVTHVKSLKNEEVIIPNSTILNREVTNYSTLVDKRGLILHTIVGIGYETPWRQVEAMLKMAAARTAGILRDPEPFILQKRLADFAVEYELNAYCDNEKRTPELYSGLHANIQDVFNEYGVQIMTPAYERDPPEAKVVPREKWYTDPAVAPAAERESDGTKT